MFLSLENKKLFLRLEKMFWGGGKPKIPSSEPPKSNWRSHSTWFRRSNNAYIKKPPPLSFTNPNQYSSTTYTVVDPVSITKRPPAILPHQTPVFGYKISEEHVRTINNVTKPTTIISKRTTVNPNPNPNQLEVKQRIQEVVKKNKEINNNYKLNLLKQSLYLDTTPSTQSGIYSTLQKPQSITLQGTQSGTQSRTQSNIYSKLKRQNNGI